MSHPINQSQRPNNIEPPITSLGEKRETPEHLFFAALAANLPSINSVSETHNEASVLSDQDHALLEIWEVITRKRPELRKMNADQVRTWMASPENRVLLQKISVLNLSEKNLRVIPPEISYFTNLHSLRLGYNNIKVIPPEIQNLIQLEYLDLSGNQITKIPPEIGHLIQLEHLDLGYNRITEIPLEIQHLTQLNCLNLHGNKITVLPPEIGHLIQLKHLDLGYNQITEIPFEIQHLAQLYHLNLRGNKITVLPPEIQNFFQLKSLELGFQFTKNPSHISGWTQEKPEPHNPYVRVEPIREQEKKLPEPEQKMPSQPIHENLQPTSIVKTVNFPGIYELSTRIRHHLAENQNTILACGTFALAVLAGCYWP